LDLFSLSDLIQSTVVFFTYGGKHGGLSETYLVHLHLTYHLIYTLVLVYKTSLKKGRLILAVQLYIALTWSFVVMFLFMMGAGTVSRQFVYAQVGVLVRGLHAPVLWVMYNMNKSLLLLSYVVMENLRYVITYPFELPAAIADIRATPGINNLIAGALAFFTVANYVVGVLFILIRVRAFLARVPELNSVAQVQALAALASPSKKNE